MDWLAQEVTEDLMTAQEVAMVLAIQVAAQDKAMQTHHSKIKILMAQEEAQDLDQITNIQLFLMDLEDIMEVFLKIQEIHLDKLLLPVEKLELNSWEVSRVKNAALNAFLEPWLHVLWLDLFSLLL